MYWYLLISHQRLYKDKYATIGIKQKFCSSTDFDKFKGIAYVVGIDGEWLSLTPFPRKYWVLR